MLALKKKNGTDNNITTMIVSRRRLKEPTARASADRHFFQELDVIERLAAAKDDAADRVIADHDGQASLLTQKHVDVLEQRTAAREHHAFVHDVGRELGRRSLESEQHRLDDGVERLGQGFADFV